MSEPPSSQYCGEGEIVDVNVCSACRSCTIACRRSPFVNFGSEQLFFIREFTTALRSKLAPTTALVSVGNLLKRQVKSTFLFRIDCTCAI